MEIPREFPSGTGAALRSCKFLRSVGPVLIFQLQSTRLFRVPSSCAFNCRKLGECHLRALLKCVTANNQREARKMGIFAVLFSLNATTFYSFAKQHSACHCQDRIVFRLHVNQRSILQRNSRKDICESDAVCSEFRANE